MKTLESGNWVYIGGWEFYRRWVGNHRYYFMHTQCSGWADTQDECMICGEKIPPLVKAVWMVYLSEVKT